MTASPLHRAGDAPLLVIGLDAGEPTLLRRWMASGDLPHLSAIAAEGAWWPTGGPELAMEHGAWVTLLTGVPRAVHGHYYFRELVPGTYDLALMDGPAEPPAPFWHDLHRGPVVIVDPPHLLPVPGLAGVQVSDLAVHNRTRPISAEPVAEARALRRRLGSPRDIAEAIRSDAATDRAIRRALHARLRHKGALVRALVARERPSLCVAVFGESHTAGHQFWPYLRGRAHDDALADALRDVYVALDAEIGALRAAMPPAHTVVVLTSVGLRDLYPSGDLTEQVLRALGWQTSPPPAAATSPLDLARRLLPESWRIALSRGLGRGVRERLLADAFAGATDWSTTRAFAIPGAYQGYVRVNLQGREPRGCVRPGEEYETLLAEITSAFDALRDATRGTPMVANVRRAVPPGTAPPRRLPDLIIDWHTEHGFVAHVTHPRGEFHITEPEFFRDSEHTEAGVLYAAGPVVRVRGAQPTLDALAVAPLLRRLAEGGSVDVTTVAHEVAGS